MNFQLHSGVQSEKEQKIQPTQLEPLDLNFMDFKKNKSKKKRTGTLSDRKNNQAQNQSLQYEQQPKTDRIALLEKKKNYSAAIRERNLLLTSNNKQKSTSGNKSFKSNNSKGGTKNSLKQMKENLEKGLHNPKKQITNQEKVKTGSKIRNKSRRNHSLSVSALDLEPIPHANTEQGPLNPYQQEDSLEIIEQHTVEKKSNQNLKFNKKKLTLTTNIISYKHTSKQVHTKQNTQQIKQLTKKISFLERQNLEYKKQLTSSKQQTARLEKELDEAKQYIQQLKNRAEEILQQSIGITRLSFSSRNRISEEQNRNSEDFIDKKQYQIENINIVQSIKPGAISDKQDVQYYEDLIQNLQKQLKEAEMLNSGLQLRAMMSEKKMIEETNAFRKKVAKEISMWRERCAQLRSANMRLKSKNQLTISMEISKDEEE